jgi:hypothetical protein
MPLSVLLWQNYDDNLFMRLGMNLAQGKWLGHFNELTLIKGPGYPLFLAVNSWLGIPISLAHAIFYCVALIAISLVVLKASRSHLLAFLVFLVPLWHPKLFEVERIVRDMIYASQAILFVALFSYCILIANVHAKARWAYASGAMLGWFWLTREEGVWIVPAIVLTVVYSFFRHRDLPTWENILKPTLLTLATFGVVQAVFCLGNWAAYGSFSGVDVKERNFQAALSAMEAVQVGDRKAYVSVPREVRERIYGISPSFAELQIYLDPVGKISPWEAGGCMYHKETCGDIGTGFYMWALREAAGKAGHYISPKAAAIFFGAIAADIRKACDQGLLSCNQKSLPYMPPMTDDQFSAIPRTAAMLIETVAVPTRPNAEPWDVWGANAEFEQALRFLNYPHRHPLRSDSPFRINLVGWYFDRTSPDEWFDVRVTERNGELQPHLLTRYESPDLIKTFANEKAGNQRFNLSTTCYVGCKIAFATASGANHDLVIGNHSDAVGNYIRLGEGRLAFDIVGIPLPDKQTKAAQGLISFLYATYQNFIPVLLGVGIVGCIYAFYLAFSQRTYPVILCIAGASWAAVIARAAILVLLDVSSFPGVTTIYLYPIFSMSAIAACLSIVAAYALSRGREQM